MSKILRLTRTAPALVWLGQAHLGGAAAPIRADRVRVTRAEITAIFGQELGYNRRDLRAGL